jgi:hypothetical protein
MQVGDEEKIHRIIAAPDYPAIPMIMMDHGVHEETRRVAPAFFWKVFISI